MKHWPCASCRRLLGGIIIELCDDCFAIKQAEERQRQELADIYAGRRSRTWGADLGKRLSDGFKAIDASETDDEGDDV